MSKELKADEGAFQCDFYVEGKVKEAGYCFCVVNKERSKGQFKPVYKTECKAKEDGKHSWNIIISDTDTLAERNPMKKVLFQIFKFDEVGKHKLLEKVEIPFGDIEKNS